MLNRPLILASCLISMVFASQAAVLAPADGAWRYAKGTAEASSPDPASWRSADYDDSTWSSANGPFYFGKTSPGTALSDMAGKYSSIFLRRTFKVTNLLDAADLTLNVTSDDGFIAWLNGAEIARFNVPNGAPSFNTTAITSLTDPLQPLTYRVDGATNILTVGTNVLAIQAFNSAIDNSDFLISASLSGQLDQTAPTIVERNPAPNAKISSLNSVEVVFSEPVLGVDATDLLINGVAATNVISYAPGQFVFEFPQPNPGTVQVSWDPAHGITDSGALTNPFTATSWSYTLETNTASSTLSITEFMASNTKGIKDLDKDFSDWIEIFNPTTDVVHLEGWYLTDDAADLTKWRFPIFDIQTNSYIIVWASAKNKGGGTNGTPMHTNFRLGTKAGGYLALVNPLGKVVSEFASYPAQSDDISYGRLPGDPNITGYFVKSTPGAPNTVGGTGFAPPVEFSRPSSTFTAPGFVLTLRTFATNAVIRYTITTNGTQALTNAPTAASPLYSGPILITNSVHVRARAFLPGLLPGPVQSETYFELSSNIVNFKSDLPLVVFHDFFGKTPTTVNKFMVMQLFDRRNGIASLTNAPDISERAIFRLRGSSTEGLPMHSLAVEVQDEFGNDKNISPLGMPAESDWVFYAPNNFEPVLIHNPLAYDLSRQMGRYASRTRMVEVFLNENGGPITTNNYAGIYSFEEKIKRGPDRVDVAPLLPEDNTEPQISGGYIFKIDRTDPSESPFTAGGQSINYVYPKYIEMISPQRTPQKNYVIKWFNDFNASLKIRDYTNAIPPYDKYIDVPAWIDHHVHNVFTFNVDALRLSGYFHKDKGGKVAMGPVWDFDRTLNSTDGRDANPAVWRSQTGDLGTDFFNFPWWADLFKDPNFWQKWIDRWQELRPTVFSTNNLNATVDFWANQVRNAWPREQAKWKGGGINSRYGTGNRATNYQGEVDALKDWMRRRAEFFDKQFVDPVILQAGQQRLALNSVLSSTGSVTVTLSKSLIASNGVIFYTLDGTDPRAQGGTNNPNALIYDTNTTIVVTKNTRITARVRDLTHKNLTGANNPPISSPWSGPMAATFMFNTPSLIISEIMYHPSEPPAGSTNSAKDFEYIELKNTGTTALDLTGFTLRGDLSFNFTGSAVTNLAPGAYVLLVRNAAAFASRYGTLANVAGEYTGSLDNAGGHLVLLGPAMEPIEDFHFENQWYPITNGEGFSLVAANEGSPASAPWGNKASWRISSVVNGSPGRADTAPPIIAPILINEVVANTTPPNVDQVELYNPGTNAVNISGWYLTDDPNQPKKFKFPAGTSVPARGYLVVDEKSFNAGTTGFAFSSVGDEVYLYSADASGNLTGYRHGFKFDGSAEQVSFGRYVNSVGEEKFVAQTTNTFGAVNAGPAIGPIVINEILANPFPVNGQINNTVDEFIELKNISTKPVDLFDAAIPTNTWHIRGGVEFEFHGGTTIPAGGYLVVVSFDPELETGLASDLRVRYGIPTQAQMVGPFRGNLNNAGDRLTLNRPLTPLPAQPGEDPVVPRVVVDEVNYDFVAKTGVPDLMGPSLQRIPSTAFGDDPASWQVGLPTAGRDNAVQSTADSDGDGLPDEWEIAHGLDPKSAAGVNGAAGDPDNDGISNINEFISGTDPKNAQSYLHVSSIAASSGNAVLTFTAQAWRGYTLLYRVNVTGSPWQKLMDVPAAGFDHQVQITDSSAISQPRRFYRLVTPQLP